MMYSDEAILELVTQITMLEERVKALETSLEDRIQMLEDWVKRKLYPDEY